MLKLVNITKNYVMKESEVKALKGISLCFRKNEFVSILGPSGCGKTTLLNILGGLDHYTDGDLIIEGRSTKNYTDRDWDIYRNHRIGFIFQSYNLIPHQNVLENVELALTIAGISKEERERRAKIALDKVGLKDMYKKKPNQLSGGQCQRVAIARALVNEPEILLADEPTGALDSETSIQIMELIKEISKERLVIMVTHNPELAQKYSTRIISLLDGRVVDDSMPLSQEEEEKERANSKLIETGKEKAQMSLLTAFKLSGKNLWSKVKRTVMIVIAAAIGIIGVSAVLSISQGVSGYIESMQDEMLSGNPLSVSRSSYDLSSLLSSTTSSDQKDIVQEGTKDGYINVDFMTERLVDSANTLGNAMITNDIDENYVKYIQGIPKENYSDITMFYGINPTYNIYTQDEMSLHEDGSYFSLGSIPTIATNILSKEEELSSYASIIDSLGSSLSQSINNSEYLLSQYDIVAGEIATKEDELMIVLDSNEMISDMTLSLLGYYGQDDILNLVYKYTEDERYDEERFEQMKSFSYEDLMSKKFYYYKNDSVFTENLTPIEKDLRPYMYEYTYTASQKAALDQQVQSLELKVVGILTPKEGRMYSSLSSGFYYTPAFTERYIKDNQDSQIVSFIREYVAENSSRDGYITARFSQGDNVIDSGIYYTFPFEYNGVKYDNDRNTAENAKGFGAVGQKDSLSSLLGMMSGSNNAVSATLTVRAAGGETLPSSISFYPKTFEEKYLITDYLDKWNREGDITIDGVTLKKEDRKEINYTDNLEVIIAMINSVITVITIALICFTALSLVVSTVMIAIITYVSVMERVKEIGVIRALGGRKKDVSHLFNAETFIIGLASGLFGIAFTYLIQGVINLIVRINYPAIGSIAALSPLSAVIIILISILLTSIAGLIPAHSAAKKDPVVALRTE